MAGQGPTVKVEDKFKAESEEQKKRQQEELKKRLEERDKAALQAQKDERSADAMREARDRHTALVTQVSTETAQIRQIAATAEAKLRELIPTAKDWTLDQYREALGLYAQLPLGHDLFRTLAPGLARMMPKYVSASQNDSSRKLNAAVVTQTLLMNVSAHQSQLCAPIVQQILPQINAISDPQDRRNVLRYCLIYLPEADRLAPNLGLQAFKLLLDVPLPPNPGSPPQKGDLPGPFAERKQKLDKFQGTVAEWRSRDEAFILASRAPGYYTESLAIGLGLVPKKKNDKGQEVPDYDPKLARTYQEKILSRVRAA